MNRPRSLDDVFNDALDRPREDRAAFLREACGPHEPLLREVEDLLRAHDAASGFLADSAMQSAELLDGAGIEDVLFGAAALSTGDAIGRYRVVERVASGGMGVVLRAIRDDGSFEQEVAVKVLPRGLSGEAMRRRFQRERQTLAQLSHPCITRLLDGGATEDGLPFLVMEFVHGRPIDEFCDANRLSVPDRLALFQRVCEGVHHAHQNLVVHRDLKPGNILVTEQGEPKLLDFGIARLLEDGGPTHSAEITLTVVRALTPSYASPEQVRGGPITTATDVYSLGVILYELLCGRRPYDLNPGLTLRNEQLICDLDPPLPSVRLTSPGREGAEPVAEAVSAGTIAAGRQSTVPQLVRTLRGDLDRIVLRALAKEPRRRYASVQEFLEDIRRYLVGLPVLARRDTVIYRVSKFVRRNAAITTAAALTVAALLTGTAIATLGFVRARSESLRAQHEREVAIAAQADTAATLSFLQNVLAAASPYRRARDASVLEVLADAVRRVERDLVSQPAVEASARYAIAETYAGLWLWPEAATQVRRSLEIRRELYGPDDLRVADCMVLLGRALTFGNDPSAEALQRDALAIRRRHLSRPHPDIAESMVCLGYSLWGAASPRRWDEAVEWYQTGIEMERPLAATPREHLARHQFSFGVLLSQLGRMEEAESNFQAALQLYRGLSGASDRYALECRKKYAVMLIDLERFEDAESLLLESLELSPPSMNDIERDSPRWLLARLRAKQGRGPEAMELATRVLVDEILRRGTNPGETDVAGIERDGTSPGSTRATLALPAHLATLMELPRDARPSVELYLADASEMLCDLGEFDAANRLIEKWNASSPAPGSAPPRLRAILNAASGYCHLRSGRFDDARLSLRRTLRILAQEQDASPWESLRVARRLDELERLAAGPR